MQKIRRAILTGGGHATRLRPITHSMNKHLIPLANKPMIFHAIDKAVEAGIEEVFINTNPGETELQKYIGDGGHWGIKIKFFEQTGGPQGIAHVVNEAKEFIGDEPFMFYLSDNIVLGSIKPMLDNFAVQKLDCMLAFAKVPDPNRFGVPYFDQNNKLIDVVEKPQNPPNDFAVTGIYLYASKVFFEAFKKMHKSPRGEYEISDIHSYFLKNNFNVGYAEITGWWKDTGKPEDLILASSLLLAEMPADKFLHQGNIEAAASLSGRVHVGVGSSINKNVKITGPVIIGENCTLEDCVINANTTIGAGSTIKDAEVGDSIILNKCTIGGGVKLSNSIIGGSVTIIKKPSEQQKMILGENTYMEV